MAEPYLKEPDASTERKVKVEQSATLGTTAPRLKVENVDSECSATSEIAVLRILLKKKEKEEIKQVTEIVALSNENKRLKQKRELDLARIESLEAEVARFKNLQVKREDPQPPKTKHTQEEPILIISDDEETEDNHSGAPGMVDMLPSPLTSPASSPGPATNDEPSRDPSSPVPDAAENAPHNRDSNSIQRREGAIDVVIKEEGEPNQFKRVRLIKSEDRNFDIWNVDGFDLGPTIQVDEKYNRGFTRKAISDAFGGGPQDCRHHWKPKPGKPGKTPFVTFKRARNNALPISPGLHGMAFSDMTKCPIAPEPINVFVGEGINNWRLLGTYDYLRWGNIAAHHIPLLPREVRNNWAKDKLKAKDWVEKANEHLKPGNRIEHSSAGIMEALKDGRLEIPFSILKCVGYPKDWFDKLLYYEKHPKPKKSKKSAVKLGKRERRGQDHGSDSDGENDEKSNNGDEEYVDAGQEIAAVPTRTSPRKKQRFQSVEA